MFDGVKVNIGGSEFVVPPISCWAAKRVALIFRDAAAREATEDGWVDVLWQQIGLVLEPNYPGLDVEPLQKAVPLRDLGEVHAAVMKASGAAKESGKGEAGSP